MRTASDNSTTRATGMVLYTVLVILAMMSLVTVSLMHTMQAEVAAYDASTSRQQAYRSAFCGIERAMSILVANRDDPVVWYDDEDLFRDQLVLDDAAEQWYFTVYAYDPDDPETPRYGAVDEAGRININTADRDTLLALPNMTEELADSLLDYRDADSRTLSQGAEQDYYDRLAFPYAIRNDEFGTLEELLLVRGFDAAVVFGEDVNRNGLLDANENDGDLSFPPDNSDGTLDRGLAAVATAFTVESHLDSDGLPKLDLNGSNPASLGLPPQAQQYVQARLDASDPINHPVELLNDVCNGVSSGIGPQDMDDILQRYTAVAPIGINPFSPNTSLGGGIAGGGNVGGGGGLPPALVQFAQSIGAGGSSASGGTTAAASGRASRMQGFGQRGAGGGGAGGTGGGGGSPTSPAVEPTAGLVNVNTASVDVLAAVGDMGVVTARDIVAMRESLPLADRQTSAWLLTEGLVGEAMFKRIARMLTARSDQYRVQVVGYGVPSGRFCVLEAVVDLSTDTPRIVYLRRLTRLGAPFAMAGPDGPM